MARSNYMQLFIDEGREHVQNMTNHLLELEKSPGTLPIVEEVFRSAHTLKGMAATMEFHNLSELTHTMENVLDALRNETLAATSETLDHVFEAVDLVEEMIDDVAEGGNDNKDIAVHLALLKALTSDDGKEEGAVTEKVQSLSYDEFEQTVLTQSAEQGYTPYDITVTLDPSTLLKAARVHMVFNGLGNHGEVIKTSPPVEDLEEENFEHTFRLAFISKRSIEELEAILYKVSEITSVRIETITGKRMQRKETSQEETANDPTTFPEKKETKRMIKVDIERLDRLMNLFEEWVVDRSRLERNAQALQNQSLTETVERMSRISEELQTVILNMRMVPVEHVFNRFPRMVRKVSKDLGKKVKIEIEGEKTELDRSIIDEIGDPLVHLLRNSIDHGIELPETRMAAGKNEAGTVRLSAYHSGNHVYIQVSDDGAGIDKEKLVKKAISQSIITESDAKTMTDPEKYDLLFSPGFSTAETITDVSGRGVGLDVVRQTFESLGGVVSVDSELGKGSFFSVQLPLTLSIIEVLLVQVKKETYGIPISAIMETAIITEAEVRETHDRKVMEFRGHIIPLLFLHDVFQAPNTKGAQQGGKFHSVVIINKEDRYVGLVVDQFIGHHEVVLKSLGSFLQDVFAISGATVVGDGEAALIIDTDALVKK
ncbi:chemotaxis protein CheA [Salicibibacter halophilus]|uniref:Chemotaxis protein CheA n=1 Tax=Salicibibacter halophilus TaxID=2502791 RepID=A0A514LGP6_9BACI|nr:chemotaxis protein CheA [Salicibibacter halophilus]QDI91020.1 chemotaxis protein CheA [Salicibibacter halophilus]